MNTAQNKIAGAPISWGVCEVPGCGYQLPPDRVLTEMREIGLAATELGPEGFLPTAPEAMADVLSRHQLHAIGGFTPLLLHRPDHDPLRDVIEVLERYAGTGARTLVLSADSGLAGYDTRPTLDEQGWATLLANLNRIDAVATEHDVRAVLHPHVGTMIEHGDEVQRVLEGSSISLCLDTGHLLIGGTDPAELTRQVPHRIAHTHMKDVDLGMARQVRSGRAHLHRGGPGRHVPPARQRGCRCRCDRQAPAQAGLRRLVRPRAGHHPHRRTPRRGPGGRRAHQRRVPAEADQRQRMSASTSAGSAESRCPLPLGTPIRPPSCSSWSAVIPGLHAVKST
jgi:inosose dehydratase